GGGIALRLAADGPERVASLTLLGSVGPWVEKSELALALERGENPLVARSLADFDRMMGLVMVKPPYIPRTIRAHLASVRSARAESWSVLFEGFVASPPEEGYLEKLGEILAPALVIHGSKDRVIHPSTGRALAAQLRRSRHLSLPDVGHVPHMEATRLVADALLEHVRASSRREVG
ncbi:MAG TPA: alpha/beta fold hydrolase, partial [Polyangiaceae bacterium]